MCAVNFKENVGTSANNIGKSQEEMRSHMNGLLNWLRVVNISLFANASITHITTL